MNDFQEGGEEGSPVRIAVTRINSILANGLLPASTLAQRGLDHDRSADPEFEQQLEGIEWQVSNNEADLYSDLYRNSLISVISVMMEESGNLSTSAPHFYITDTMRKRAISNVLVAVPINSDFKPVDARCESVSPKLIERIYVPQRIFDAVDTLATNKQNTQLIPVPYTTIEFKANLERNRQLEVPDYYKAVVKDFGNPRRDVWLTGVRIPLGI